MSKIDVERFESLFYFNPVNLAGWIIDSQRIKPGNPMLTMDLNGEELHPRQTQLERHVFLGVNSNGVITVLAVVKVIFAAGGQCLHRLPIGRSVG